ncbi:hypothetical protein SAMN05421812_102483 [Asanoa hainanensis]|uniref:Uncharacterized protein n=1 Tax=Asanoa hainanensis TaxID=560556 RepID=A0A239IP13_9ACTN|nr:hypothetical protein [Asanoa hainanensis]SNS95102.1 hypothetical protein SAMN05421812_102483 [Asanoa hainanensis]
MDALTCYALASAIGGAVGAAELASRYRDDPGRSLIRPAALLYVLINCAASASALAIIRIFGWTFGQTGQAQDLVRVLVGGLGAVALFRTKLFAGSERGSTVNWSPSGLLDRLLAISDRQVDRAQAKRRSMIAKRMMPKVSFDKAYGVLPAFALNLLEGASKEEQQRLSADVVALVDDKTLDDAAKAMLLGVAVMRVTGVHLFVQAIDGLGPIIANDPVPRPDRPPPEVDPVAAVVRQPAPRPSA